MNTRPLSPMRSMQILLMLMASLGVHAHESIALPDGDALELIAITGGRVRTGPCVPEPAESEVTRLMAVRGWWILASVVGLGGACGLLVWRWLQYRITRKSRFQFGLLDLVYVVSLLGLGSGGIVNYLWGESEFRDRVDSLAQLRGFIASADFDEMEVHEAEIRDFLIGRYEVTEKQYLIVMKGSSGGNLAWPVSNVSYYDACDFCERLSALSGRRVRLPSEIEWEYACRAGTSFVFSTGNRLQDLDAEAWYSQNSGRVAHRVGTRKPNKWGIHDMLGNVLEWVETPDRGVLSPDYSS